MYDDQLLVEMSNIQPKQTGLNYIVQIMSKGGAKHGPRVKVSNVPGTFHYADNFSVTLETPARVIGNCKIKSSELDDIKDWIALNRKHINDVWNNNGTMSGTDIDSGIKKL